MRRQSWLFISLHMGTPHPDTSILDKPGETTAWLLKKKISKVSFVDQSSSEVGSAEVGPAQHRPGEIGSAEVSSIEVCPSEDSYAQACQVDISLPQARQVEICSTEVSSPEHSSAHRLHFEGGPPDVARTDP